VHVGSSKLTDGRSWSPSTRSERTSNQRSDWRSVRRSGDYISTARCCCRRRRTM